METAAAVLEDISGVVAEYAALFEPLSVLEFVNYLELYAYHRAEHRERSLPFERFVATATALADAAERATADTGVATAAPPVLETGA